MSVFGVDKGTEAGQDEVLQLNSTIQRLDNEVGSLRNDNLELGIFTLLSVYGNTVNKLTISLNEIWHCNGPGKAIQEKAILDTNIRKINEIGTLLKDAEKHVLNGGKTEFRSMLSHIYGSLEKIIDDNNVNDSNRESRFFAVQCKHLLKIMKHNSQS